MMKKQTMLPVLVLTLICVVVAAVLGIVNVITGPVIEETENEKVYESLKQVLDGEFETVEKLPEHAPDTVNAMYRVTEESGALKGHVVTLTVKGYAGDISMTVGVDTEGKVTKAVITKESESHGKPGMDNYPDNFSGVKADELADVELFSGATVSSTAIKEGVIDAVRAVMGDDAFPGADVSVGGEPSPFFELLKDIVPNFEGFEIVKLYGDEPKTLKALYRETSGKGYVAYIVTSNEYVENATEALVYFDTRGKIKDVNLFVWNVGHGVGPGDFAEGFIGKTTSDIDDVELLSGATGTSADFKAAVSAAIRYVPKDFPVARTVGIAILSIALITVAAAVIIYKRERTVE